MPCQVPLPAQPVVLSHASRVVGAAVTILALSLVAGCGRGTGEVSGKVYYKGQVITSGFVTLVGSDGVTKNSEIDEDGSYRIPGVPGGEVMIAVSSPPLDPAKGRQPKKDSGNARKAIPPDRGGDSTPVGTDNQKKTWREIPIIYSDITKSNLKYMVTSGPNGYDIKLD